YCRNKRSFLLPNLEYLHHKRDVVILLKPVSYHLFQHRRRKRPKRLPPFDLRIKNGLHIGPAGITEDRAIAERSWSPFHAALKPTHDFTIGEDRCRALA